MAKKAAATEKQKNPRVDEAKQQRLPGISEEVSKELKAIGQKFIEARDQRLTWAKDEQELEPQLIEAMKKEKVKAFLVDDRRIDVTHKDPSDSIKLSTPKVQD